MKKLMIGTVVLLATTGWAMGVGFSLPAVTEAAAGSTVEIEVSAVGQGTIAGSNLALQVDEPLEIVGLDLLAGVFAENNTGQLIMLNSTHPVDIPAPQYAVGAVVTNTGTVATPGLLAKVSVLIPVGTPDGDYTILTQIPGVQGSDWAGSAEVDSLGAGIIRVPEPMTAILLLAGLSLLRRRHA